LKLNKTEKKKTIKLANGKIDQRMFIGVYCQDSTANLCDVATDVLVTWLYSRG
jgi:hypothetical protein